MRHAIAACGGGLPADALPALAQRLREQPRCAATRFLAGCACFDAGAAAHAVRHMMVAYHADPQLEAASLLVFCGLYRVSRPGVPWLRVVLDTWQEFRRPEFDRRPTERALLDAFPAPRPGPTAGIEARLYRLPMRGLRGQLLSGAFVPGPADEPAIPA